MADAKKPGTDEGGGLLSTTLANTIAPSWIDVAAEGPGIILTLKFAHIDDVRLFVLPQMAMCVVAKLLRETAKTTCDVRHHADMALVGGRGQRCPVCGAELDRDPEPSAGGLS